MRITDFPELITPTGNDLLVTVDIANDLTKKVKLDNLPISLPALTALATKQDSLVSGTNIKTINSTSVLGSGNIAVQPTLVSGTSIKTVNSNSLLGSGDVAVQETLVSGTNIKTLNNTSLLGSGNITLTANPSGVSGAIQFSNGSAFASDAANLFWDDTNNRLGVGTDTPQTAGHFRTSGSTRGVLSVVNANDTANYGSRVQLYNKQSGDPVVDGANGFALIYTDSTKSSFVYNYSDGPMIFGTAATERMRLNNNGGLTIKGSGSTSATTSLLVQNSAGATALQVLDDRSFVVGNFGANGAGFGILAGNPTGAGVGGGINFNFNNGAAFNDDTNNSALKMTYNGGVRIPNSSRYPLTLGADTKAVASAQLEMVSTTQGLLPPRMTTTQKNAIASPATGLVLYDSTTNKLQCYNGSTWNDLF